MLLQIQHITRYQVPNKRRVQLISHSRAVHWPVRVDDFTSLDHFNITTAIDGTLVKLLKRVYHAKYVYSPKKNYTDFSERQTCYDLVNSQSIVLELSSSSLTAIHARLIVEKTGLTRKKLKLCRMDTNHEMEISFKTSLLVFIQNILHNTIVFHDFGGKHGFVKPFLCLSSTAYL